MLMLASGKIIWHNDWSNGENIPRLLLDEPKLRNRPPPSRPGKKRRCRDTAEGGEARYSEGDIEQDAVGDEARYSEGDAGQDAEGNEARYSEGGADQDAEGDEARYSEGDTEQDVDEVEERGDDTANVTVLQL
ncbi:hypothetical protein PF005_g13199 [Phytophthora fragariae]|uniref:Uncharacterized protein n=1 Tax=Phytophthora fragariae TaxID=53985 RepID=A0A6A3XRJ2_9STRA|nr:hypothetical protein PF011_g6604 [Phytophthora fragariae]KAE9205960.1 hypothetical protein PF005_g13199 [Phytophthora fragariae]KAE9219240.1 hypothetical protein PF002_g16248 [Phytophthora fragariae]